MMRTTSFAFVAFVTAVQAFRPTSSIRRRSTWSPVRPLHVQSSEKKDTEEVTTDASTYEPLVETNYLQNPHYLDGTKPEGAPILAFENFVRQGSTILGQLYEVVTTSKKSSDRLPGCLGLKLSNESVKEAERIREETGGRVEANVVSRGLYDFGCLMLDTLFDDRPLERFWFLETVARIPYFSYASMLHLYESLGWWRASELRRVHNAEEWNELHHLLIMEAMGGNSLWSDRFFAYHAAIVYYWLLNAVFLFSPRVAYHFMELLEAHAVDTYQTFCTENKARLKELPPPVVAVSYYTSADMYLFDDFQVSRAPGSRRPPCDNLYDVFRNIAVDEGEHVKTMQACQDYARMGKMVVSPHAAYTSGEKEDTASILEEKRRKWIEWSQEFGVNPLDARADDSGDFE